MDVDVESSAESVPFNKSANTAAEIYSFESLLLCCCCSRSGQLWIAEDYLCVCRWKEKQFRRKSSGACRRWKIRFSFLLLHSMVRVAVNFPVEKKCSMDYGRR